MIYLSDERYEEIKGIIADLYVKYDVKSVPVNGFELATKMGIKIIPYSAKNEHIKELLMKKSEDGFCVLRDNQWYIFYNDSKDYGRINNTILHEIGHIVLNHTEDSELAEKEVKFFAKYALVPPVLVEKFKITHPFEIMDVFGVSYKAACYALDYYYKWKMFGPAKYADYEAKIVRLISIAA